MKNLIVNLIMAAIAAAFAWFFVNAFDAWYQDKEWRRAQRRARKENRYE